MEALYRFEPSAREEYLDAIAYYASVADDERVVLRFVSVFESAVGTICGAPEIWRVVERPDVRRCVLRKFPFVIYYRYQSSDDLVVIYAVMHTSRRPGYWHKRLPTSEGGD